MAGENTIRALKLRLQKHLKITNEISLLTRITPHSSQIRAFFC